LRLNNLRHLLPRSLNPMPLPRHSTAREIAQWLGVHEFSKYKRITRRRRLTLCAALINQILSCLAMISSKTTIEMCRENYGLYNFI
jgi:hypothetical protein